MFAASRRRAPPVAYRRPARWQSLLVALGEGTFMTGSAVFFTKIVGLSAAQVGLGLTCAGAAAFLAALPMGKLVDRFGPKPPWLTTMVFLVNAAAISRLPRASHDERTRKTAR